MSAFKDPFDPDLTLGACACGEHRSQAEHDARAGDTAEALNRRVIESAVMRALFPQDAVRRRFLRAVGATTAAGGRLAASCRSARSRRWRRTRARSRRRT